MKNTDAKLVKEIFRDEIAMSDIGYKKITNLKSNKKNECEKNRKSHKRQS